MSVAKLKDKARDYERKEDWAKAVDAGRWPTEVRPYTHNRRHVLRKLV